MRTRLIVMRHAKSSWSDPSLDDHDRPLNKRGRRDAPRIALELQRLRMDSRPNSSKFLKRTMETLNDGRISRTQHQCRTKSLPFKHKHVVGSSCTN